MNSTRAQLHELLTKHADSGLPVAHHAHGDVAMDAYADALAHHHLLGTDHRWRIEPRSAGRADQFRRAVALGIMTPLAVYQCMQLGDLLDGTLFPSDIGSQWVAVAEAFKALTIDAAYHLRRDHDPGSIAVAKQASHVTCC